MCYDPCLHRVIYSVFDSDIYVSIYLLVVKVIFVYDLLGNEFDYYFVIFSLLRWIIQVEVLDI